MLSKIPRSISRLIEKAKQVKKLLQTGKTFHCTVAMKGGNILAIGYNDYTRPHPAHLFGEYKSTRTTHLTYHPGIHSEIDCIQQLLFRDDYHKITLVNIRIDNNGQLTEAGPCVNCKRVLARFKFKRIFYSTFNGTIERIKL